MNITNPSITSSKDLSDYHTEERETLNSQSAVRTELLAVGVTTVFADYDGVGDSGQIENVSYHDGSDPSEPISVDPQINDRVEALLYALLYMRHGGWENNDGAFGSFNWNLVDGTIEHEHNERFTDYDHSWHEGFEVPSGSQP